MSRGASAWGDIRRLRRLLSNFWTRVFLSACIILSLIPNEFAAGLDLFFLLLFAFEFGARALLVFRGLWDEDDADFGDPDRRWPPSGRLIALGLDFVALLSFLPVPLGAHDTRWLRIFRLSRMVLLFGYWAPVVRDMWSVLLRRERARQIALMGVVVLALSFAGTVVLENLSIAHPDIDFDGNGGVDGRDDSFLVRWWWAFRQIQDPGNMLQSPSSWVALGVSVGLTVSGLMLVSFLIGLGTDVVRELVEIGRLRPPGFRGHTVVVNVDAATRPLLHELMGYHRKLLPGGRVGIGWARELWTNAITRLGSTRYVVVGHEVEPPDYLRHDDLARLVYRHGARDPGEFAARADVAKAQRVVLLADLEAEDPDAETLEAILTLRESMHNGFSDDERGRARLLIAEILDESNVAAAHSAIGGGPRSRGRPIRAFVVPSERLISAFFACLTRTPGIGRLFEELLTSRGQEIYTCYFNLSGLGYAHHEAPSLPDEPVAALDTLRRKALGAARSELVPIGILVSRDARADELEVHLNPQPEDLPEQARKREGGAIRGFVAVAPNFSVVRDFSDSLYLGDKAAVSVSGLGDLPRPELKLTPPASLRRVLLVGFRSSTVGLVESLLIGGADIEIMILVEPGGAKRVRDDFDAHNQLLTRGLMSGTHGSFPRLDETSWSFSPAADDGSGGEGARVHVVEGDQTSSRRLAEFPAGFGELHQMDAVLLVASDLQGSDARAAKTLMKIDALTRASHAAAAERGEGEALRAPRVIVEVLDADLARRLRARYREVDARAGGLREVIVYSFQELRSYFMFQSVVVPSFDLVYEELMGAWGQSLVRYEVDGVLGGRCTAAELGTQIEADRGELLIACEIESEDRTELRVGSSADIGGGIALDRLRAVWTIARDRSGRDHARRPNFGPAE